MPLSEAITNLDFEEDTHGVLFLHLLGVTPLSSTLADHCSASTRRPWRIGTVAFEEKARARMCSGVSKDPSCDSKEETASGTYTSDALTIQAQVPALLGFCHTQHPHTMKKCQQSSSDTIEKPVEQKPVEKKL
ncbi:unnamed protein product [Leuciscus chuanchicus]